ncbi:8-amino-3,8-dideoxy-manno-octulosonate cytidylyltransferase [subsurface metagenome]
MKLFALITARCSSERFPNKVISMLGGKPMLEQIILRCKKLKGLDGIVVSTSYLTSDNVIQNICEDNNVECYRGEIHNLASRHLETWNEYGMTHALTVAGDSPFFSIIMAQRLINEIRANPEYWRISMPIPWGTAISGIYTNCIKKDYMEKQIEALKKCNDPKKMEEYYWVCYNLPVGDHRWKIINFQDIISPSTTTIKIDIDYPLEMAIMNKVIDYLGYFPEHYSDIERAYKEITEI